MKKVVKYLFVLYQSRFLLHIYILIVVMFRILQGKTLSFEVFLLSFFFFINSGGLFRLSVSGKARSFVQSRPYVRLRIS